MKKNNEADNSLNAVEREPVLNPTASKASYKPKQRSCGKTKLKQTKPKKNDAEKKWDDHSTGGISWGDNSTGGGAGVAILQVVVLEWQFYK